MLVACFASFLQAPRKGYRCVSQARGPISPGCLSFVLGSPGHPSGDSNGFRVAPLDGRAKKTCLNRGTNPPCALESINRFWTSSGHESALRSNQRSVAGGILVSRGQQRSPAKISCRKQGASCRDGALLCANFFQEQSQEVQWNQQIDLKMGQNKANFEGESCGIM